METKCRTDSPLVTGSELGTSGSRHWAQLPPHVSGEFEMLWAHSLVRLPSSLLREWLGQVTEGLQKPRLDKAAGSGT